MLGSKVIEIGEREFLAGLTSSAYSTDGGFSEETDAVNITKTPGVLYAPAAVTDESTNLAGNIIASSGDANVLGNTKYFVTTTGKYFTWDGTDLTLRQTDSSGSYAAGTTDMVQFQLKTYASYDDDVALATGSDLGTFDATWWSATIGGGQGALQTFQRHPLLVFEKNLWIGDKSELHRFDGTTASSGFLTLSSEQSITALGTDPGSGKMLIAITEGTNYSGTEPQIAKILIYDGFSNKPRRAVTVDSMVTGFYSVGGTTYVTYGQNLGYWNGSGITFLRRFKNIPLSGESLAYKHHLTNIDNTLYVADGARVLAYGSPRRGPKVFYPVYENSAGIDCVVDIGDNKLGIGYATAKFDTLDLTAVDSTSTMTFYSKKYNFPRSVHIRGVYIEYADSIASSANPGTFSYIDQQQTVRAMSSLANPLSGATYTLEALAIEPNVRTRSVQFRYVADTIYPGVKRFLVYYDPAE